MDPKVVKIDVSKVVSGPLGVLKQVVSGDFDSYLTYSSPCKFPKPRKWTILGLTMQCKGVWGGRRRTTGEGCGRSARGRLSLEQAKRATKGLGDGYRGGDRWGAGGLIGWVLGGVLGSGLPCKRSERGRVSRVV